MDIILLERVEKLGQIGDLVSVKSGFARNYLLPQGKAVFASKENIKLFEERKSQLEGENIARKNEAQKVKPDTKEILIKNQLSNFKCPVCMEIMKKPLQILSCSNDHFICSECVKDSSIKECPICRESFMKNKPKRRYQSEKMLVFLYKILEQ